MSSDLSVDEAALLALVPNDGSNITNPNALRQLGWDEAHYWSVRDSLEDRGLIVRWRGRGGVIRRPVEDVSSETVTSPPPTTPIVEDAGDEAESTTRERLLYPDMRAVIQGDWSRERRARPVLVEISAAQGRRPTGGIWSRPDIVSIEVKAYEYLPGKTLEVTTFEVKPSDRIDVQAVYEALAHRRSATRSWVLLHVPTHAQEQMLASITDLASVARMHGIGVVVAGDPADYTTWETLEEAQRFEPDPDRLNDFIERQISEAGRRALARQLR